MGSGGLQWDTKDNVLKDRLNEKTLFRGTGAQIAAAPAECKFFLCTETGSGYDKDKFYYRDASGQIVPLGVDVDMSVYPHSTNIGDYSTPTGATASGGAPDGIDTTTNWSTTDNGMNPLGIDIQAIGMKITDIAQRNKFVRQIAVTLRKVGNPSFDIVARLRRFSDKAIIATSTTTRAASSISTTSTSYTFDFVIADARTPNEDFMLVLEVINGVGNASNYIQVQVRSSGSSYEGGHLIRFVSGVWSEFTDADVRGSMTLQSKSSASNAVDDNTGTHWKSDNEVNPWLSIELSGSADKEPSAIALYPHSDTTATELLIQTSPDGGAWTTVRTILVSALTMGAWNYIRFNRPTQQIRYIRIYGNDGSAKILAISEVKVLSPTESQWNRRHGHQLISSSVNNLPLSG